MSIKKLFVRKFVIIFIILLLAVIIFPAKIKAEEIDPMKKMSQLSDKIADKTDQRVHISGYVNIHYMDMDGMVTTINPDKDIDEPLLQLREAALFADAQLTDNWLFSTELEMSYDSSYESASSRHNEFEALFNYYYLTYNFPSRNSVWNIEEYGSLSLRVGRILVPFLSYNENKPNFKQNFISQPYTAWTVAPLNHVDASFQQFGWTDTGVMLVWNHILSDLGLLDVKLSVINGLRSEDPDVLDSNTVQLNTSGVPTIRPRDGLFANRSDWYEFDDNNTNKATVLKVSFIPVGRPLDFGVSWYRGKWDNDGDHDLSMYGTHFNYLERNWTLKAEYVKSYVAQTGGINIVSASGPAAINISTGDYSMQAWYLEGSYIPLRYGVNDHYIRLIARYDDVDTNNKALFTPFDRSRITLGTEWEFLNNIRLRYEWQRISIDSFGNAPSAYVSAGGNEHIYMSMVSLIAYF